MAQDSPKPGPARLAAADDMGFAHGWHDAKRSFPRARKRPFFLTAPPPRRRPGPSWKGHGDDGFRSVGRVARLGPGVRRGGKEVGGGTLPCSPAKAGAQTGSPPSRGNIKAASPCEEAAFSQSASHGQSPCRRPRRAAPAGLGRVLHQLGAGRPAPQNLNATVPRRLCQRKLSSERLNAVPAVFGASTNGLFAGCVPRVTRTRASSS